MNERTFQTKPATCSRDVISFYDAYAPTWDDRFGGGRATRAFHRERLASFLSLARLKPTDRVIELGVGTGAYLDTIAPLVRQVVAIDGSLKMLSQLRVKHGHLSNLMLRCSDVERHLGYGSADVVYAFGLLEHIIQPDALLDNCRRLVEPGGWLIFVGPNGRCSWYGRLRQVARAGPHCSTDRYYTLREMAELVEPYGFTLEAYRYWGWCPAGVSDVVYYPLALAGKLAQRVIPWWAGGLTVSFLKDGA